MGHAKSNNTKTKTGDVRFVRCKRGGGVEVKNARREEREQAEATGFSLVLSGVLMVSPPHAHI